MKYLSVCFGMFFIFLIFNVSAVQTPHTPQVITARGFTVFPVSFFNNEEGQIYSAFLKKNQPVVKIESESMYVGKNEFGSFNLKIAEGDFSKGVYFDELIISNTKGLFQKIPIIIGLESKSSEIEYDVSIDFNPNLDVTTISGEIVLSPDINVYKLNFNNRNNNAVNIKFQVYSIYGELLLSENENVSVSRQARFKHFFNLGDINLNEIILVVFTEQGNSIGLDFEQVSLANNPLLSPSSIKDYSSRIYISIFIFLISFVVLISYLWYNHYINQAKDWKSQIDKLKKMKFSDSASRIRKIAAQRDVLQRAYNSNYISKSSYDSAMSEINKLSKDVKKRL